MQSVVLIPSLNPDEKLIKLLEGLHSIGIKDILLIDDGSKQEPSIISSKQERWDAKL